MSPRKTPDADAALAIGAVASTWRIAADTEREQLQGELDRLPETVKHDRARRCDYEIAQERLEEARKTIAAPYGLRWWKLFYSGAQIERTWACLHEAGRSLVMLLDREALQARIKVIRWTVETHIDADLPQRKEALAELDVISAGKKGIADEQREQLRAILMLCHVQSDRFSREVRAFRNILFVFSIVLGLLLVAVAVVHVLDSSLVSLCTAGKSLDGDLCPNGGKTSARFDVAQVELVGALGGLLAAVIRLARARRMPGPYGLSVAQSALKVVTGAATALVGVLLLQGGVLAGLSRQPGSSVLAYAAFFGLAQQALTGMVDRRASELADSATPTASAAPAGGQSR